MQINPTPEAFVRQVREANERDYGPKAREMARTLLSAGLPHPWLYVFELSQNARDAGARWVKWTVTDTGDVVLQHDGPEPLEERHVRGLASVGASTKGLTSVGFMGVGFKAAFSRFKTVGVSGFGWKFRFDVGTEHGDLGAERPDLFDTLLPSWAPDLPDPEPGFTTRFDLRAPRGPAGAPFEDLEHLCSVDDPTPLAVLALRGLKRVSVGDRTWGLHATDGIAEVHDSARDAPWRWVCFRASYRPDDDAMRRFLEVRKALRDQVDSTGERPFREVIALLPIDGAGRPVPPARGHIYATLPTQVELPFRFHLQADWLVNLDRQNLRDVVGDPWHEAILKQVPELIRQLLLWVAERPEVRRSGWEALLVPRSDEGTLGAAFANLRSAIGAAIGELAVVPVHGAPEQELRRPPAVWRLPSEFRAEFGRRAGWRPDLLFDRDVMDEAKLGDSATQFFLWLGYGPEIVPPIHAWPAALPRWWSGVPEDERHDALFALWNSVAAPPWQESPVVRTEDGAWVGAGRIRWLNEEPPSPGERSGEVIAAALADLLPSPGERLAPGLRQVVQKASGPGIAWFKRLRQGVELKAVIQQALADKTRREAFPLVQLLDLALSRGQRADLVPWILTEEGPRKPADALLADPYVEGGMHRRSLFGNIPAIHRDYLDVASVETLVPFFRKLGVRGDVALLPQRTQVYRRSDVAMVLDIEEKLVANANIKGYSIVDMVFTPLASPFPAAALVDWLSRGYRALDGKGRVFAESTYYNELVTRGTRKANWVRVLEAVAWVPCTDGEWRKPADVRLQADPDYEGVPIAALDSEFGKRLQQEGVEFGANVSKAPALRRLASRGAGALEDKVLAQLLRDARASVGAGEATDAAMNEALSAIRVRERPLERIVRRAGVGSGLRSDLDGWVLDLTSLDPFLQHELQQVRPSMPATTTGSQALAFLRSIWEERPKRVEELRRHLAAAYRYVADDLDSGFLRQEWNEAIRGAYLYGSREWHPLSPSLAIDDVQSPLIRGHLPGAVSVASAHIGDGREQVKRVAAKLGVCLLSDRIRLVEGQGIARPTFASRLERLIGMLSTLEDRRVLEAVRYCDRLELNLERPDLTSARLQVSAYIERARLVVAGRPAQFATEAAEQLVQFFQLGQRGSEVAWLTGALHRLDDETDFGVSLRMLAECLGVPPPPGDVEVPKPDSDDGPTRASPLLKGVKREDELQRPDASLAPLLEPDAGAPGASPSSKGNERAEDQPLPAGPDPLPVANGPESRTGLNILKFLVVDRSDDAVGNGASRPRKDDHAAREAVLRYEAARGWSAQAMDDLQPGFDVQSVDPASGRCRRIEVKGKEGVFQEDASVALSARQFRDAVAAVGSDIEYWLYVVDRTTTDEPRVYPIPWTRYLDQLKYGFYANAWLDAVDRAERVASEPERATPEELSGALAGIAAETGR